MKNDLVLQIFTVSLVVAGLLFYWFAWRPSHVRQECFKEAIELSTVPTRGGFAQFSKPVERPKDTFDGLYDKCLLEHGIVK